MWQGKSFQYFVVWQASIVDVIALELWAKPQVKVRDRAAGEPGWRWAREGRQLKAGGQQRSRQAVLPQNLGKAMSCNQEEDGSEKGQSPQGQERNQWRQQEAKWD